MVHYQRPNTSITDQDDPAGHVFLIYLFDKDYFHGRFPHSNKFPVIGIDAKVGIMTNTEGLLNGVKAIPLVEVTEAPHGVFGKFKCTQVKRKRKTKPMFRVVLTCSASSYNIYTRNAIVLLIVLFLFALSLFALC